MRILLAVFDRSSSGISSYTLEVAKLMDMYADITMLSFDKINTTVKTIFIERRKTYRAFPLFNYYNNRTLLDKVLDDFDVVHETLPPWAEGSDKYITTRWGYESYFRIAATRFLYHPFPENIGSLPVTFQHKLLDNITRSKAKHIVDVSMDTANFIPPPISLRKLKNYSFDGTLKILFVSRDLNIRRKNLKVLLESLKITKKKVELHLVGRGKAEGISYGYLSREELINLMYEMDLLVLPSIYEELGYVGLEAYSIGLPVITSDIISFRTVFRESPRFDPFSPASLSEIIDNFDADKLELIGKKSWNYVKASNTVAKDKFLRMYNSVK